MNVLHEQLIGFTNSKFMGPTLDYPYQTDQSSLSLIQTGMNMGPGLARDLAEDSVLGGVDAFTRISD